MFTLLHSKCFVFLAQGRGEGTGCVEEGARWETKDRGAVDAIPFRFILICFLFALRGQKGLERRVASAGRPDDEITVFSPGASHRARAPSRAPREPARLGGNTTGIDFT
jgi:hypothetical protein